MRILLAAVLTMLGSGGCGIDDLSETSAAVTVGGIGTTCSTASVIGLSKQIADQIGCDNPDGLVPFAASAKITITSNAVLPYLAKNAKADLVAASASGVLQVNSAFRTIAQQYLLYKWFTQGACQITAAAHVGQSNHESGRAVDLANYSARVSAMGAHGWAHDVPGDDVHFDHLGSPDIRGRDVRAFQELWNANHPDDKIGADGAYGPQTEARLAKAPATGFPIGPSCQNRTDAADVVGVTGPDRVAPAMQAHYSVVIKNTGTAKWPATTKLVTNDGMASPLHDASWDSESVVATLGAAVDIGKTTTVELDVTAPADEGPVQQLFALADGGTMFGEIPLALTVATDDMGSSDGSEGDDPGGGGCSAGGGAGGLVGLGLLGLVRRRRGVRSSVVVAVALAGCSAPPAETVDAGIDPEVDAGEVVPPDAAPKSIEILRGVDRASAFSVAEAKLLHTQHGVKWTGVYIGGACNAGSGWTKSVVSSIHAATQWQFMPIWVGQQSAAICGAHTLTAAQGTSDGNAAAAKMHDFGWEPDRNIPIALDVEGGTYSSSVAGSTAYVKAWTAAVHAKGYRAYAYSSPTGIVHFHDNGTMLDGAWVASWFFSGFHDAKPADLDQIGNDYIHQNRAWQYAGSFAVSGAGSVDADTSDLLLAPAPGGTNL